MPSHPAAPDPRFTGIGRLFGADGLARFAVSHVAVVGIGGVGCWAAEALARSGIGRLTLVDPDAVCLSNTNRQLHALASQVGRPKTTAMAERIRAIHPACLVREVPAAFGADIADAVLADAPDLVIDAIDAVGAKALLLTECRRRGLAAVTCGGAGGRRDPTRVRVDDLARTFGDPLLLAVRRALRTHHGFPNADGVHEPPPFGIDAVFSDEPGLFPRPDGSVAATHDPAGPALRNRRSAHGTCAPVCGAFGLAAAAHTLARLAQ